MLTDASPSQYHEQEEKHLSVNQELDQTETITDILIDLLINLVLIS